MIDNSSKYGFSIRQIVLSKVELIDENNNRLPAGTKLRIVAITPKVRIITNPFFIKNKPLYYDSKEYFFNAVVAGQDNDYQNRIRANFITIKTIKD